MDGSLFGTPAYMAPERFRNQAYGLKSDVYSLGISLYQMLSGRLPFATASRDPIAVAALQASAPPPPLGAFGVPAAVEEVVLAALRKNPDDRPTAEELARALAAAVRGPATPIDEGAGGEPDPAPRRP